jgi:Cation efflux family
VADATKSQALEADALHFSSDIISSAAVLVGLGFVALRYPMADAIAALVVACFVILAGYRLGRRTFDVLIDTAPEGALERVRTSRSTCQRSCDLDKLAYAQPAAFCSLTSWFTSAGCCRSTEHRRSAERSQTGSEPRCRKPRCWRMPSLETLLRTRGPEFDRIVIHAEPFQA